MKLKLILTPALISLFFCLRIAFAQSDSLTFRFEPSCSVEVPFTELTVICEQIKQTLERSGLKYANEGKVEIWFELKERVVLIQEKNDYTPYSGDGYKQVWGPPHAVASVKNEYITTELFKITVANVSTGRVIDSAGYKCRYDQLIAKKARTRFTLKRIRNEIESLKFDL